MTDWDHSLFSCFGNIKVCLFAYFLPCIPFGRTTNEAGTCGFVGGAVSFCFPIWNFFLFQKTRRVIRKRYGIDGSCLGDIATVCFCPCCALVQMKRQVDGSGMGESIERVQFVFFHLENYFIAEQGILLGSIRIILFSAKIINFYF